MDAADPVERALRRRRSAPSSAGRRRGLGPLVGLDPLPLAVHVGGGPRLRLAEHVRVAADDLRGDRGLDVGRSKTPGLGGQLGVEDDLEEQVAELPGERPAWRPPSSAS